MLRNGCSTAARLCARRASLHAAKFSNTAQSASHSPNAPIELDLSLQDLLRDADMALLKYKPRQKDVSNTSAIRELQVLEYDESLPEQRVEECEAEVAVSKERKSARAKFGSRGIGSVFIPAELRDAIENIINQQDKSRLHEDAKRLFREEKKDGSEIWDTMYEADYKSRKQAARHADRDGTAFASVALPAHYSAVYAVLDNVKHRLGKEWNVKHVLEWGSGVGSGLWASMHAFQNPVEEEAHYIPVDPLLSQSSVSSYLGIDKRDGLSSMAKRLVEVTNLGSRNVRWNRGFSDTEKFDRSEGRDVLALSAFHISSLPTHVARKELVKQMWSSGANVIVLIDHDTSAGFDSIVGAREQFLRMGRKESEDPAMQDNANVGCHVVAPCPHDGACPLRLSGSSKLNCTFSQRLQRPTFLRKTKHVRAGHEDIGYSYVVIKRGKRPSPIDVSSQTGATGDALEQSIAADADSVHNIRSEAYNWPRLVFPPLKKSKHVIIDGCTAEGQIMRMTIPRSQGKQAYYDARKSSWGDIFPHKPKNPPQVRLQPAGKSSNDPSTLPGADIGKRNTSSRGQQTASYDKIVSDLRENKKSRRRSWAKETVAFED